MAGCEFQFPVATVPDVPRIVGAGSDVGSGQSGNRVNQHFAASGRCQVATIEQQIAVGAEGAAPAGDGSGITVQRTQPQPGSTEFHRTV